MAGPAGMDRSQAGCYWHAGYLHECSALQDGFERAGYPVSCYERDRMRQVAEPYIRRRAIHLEKGRVVIFAAGTGNSHFTDTAALRALEIDAECLQPPRWMAWATATPRLTLLAVRFEHITYLDSHSKGTAGYGHNEATSLCMDNDYFMLVFDITAPGNIARVLKGNVGTTISS